jgi:ATP-dependent RNA helicase DeaD
LNTFTELGVAADLIQGLDELGITEPTEIQRLAIPPLLTKGGDLIAQAQTGTGKTAAFGIPLLAKVNPAKREIQALVVAPTRELAKQIGKQLFRFTKFSSKIFVEVVTGGDDMDVQISRLKRPTHIVVATPGRLKDLLQRNALTLSTVQFLVLDEADEMLSMGFRKELGEIFHLTTARKSTWLFSATIPDGIRNLIRDHLTPDALTLKIDQKHVVNRDISHRVVICKRTEKLERISQFLRQQKDERGVIFCRTKLGAQKFAEELTAQGFSVAVLQGDLPQLERDKVMRAFKKERVQYLIATDVAARGIDVAGLAFVIHHQLPDQIDYYTHRSGRTGRAGRKGLSIAFIEPAEKQALSHLEKILGIRFGNA